jgi:hypothetical protein
MVDALIAGLQEVIIHSSDPQTTLFEGRPVPRTFQTRFSFHDRDPTKTWNVVFFISVTDLGTPILRQVQVMGSYPSGDFQEETLGKAFAMNSSLEGIFGWTYDDYDENGISMADNIFLDRESVERWQLKVAEQFRFQLLEMAVLLAISSIRPIQYDDGTHWLLSKNAFAASEIKEISKSISKRIRQKVNPDFLKEVAEIYTQAVLSKEDPVQVLMRRYKCAHRTASEYATKARNMGLLPKTQPGKVSITIAESKSKPKAEKKKKSN